MKNKNTLHKLILFGLLGTVAFPKLAFAADVITTTYELLDDQKYNVVEVHTDPASTSTTNKNGNESIYVGASANNNKIITAASGVNVDRTGATDTTYGMLGGANGVIMNFEAGSNVKLDTGSSIRAIYIQGAGSTGTYAGKIEITDNTGGSGRAFHVNNLAVANFEAGSETTITYGNTSKNKWGLIVTNGIVNIAGKVTSTYKGEGMWPVFIGFNNGSNTDWDKSEVNVKAGGELNAVVESGASSGITLKKGGTLNSEAGSLITSTVNSANATAVGAIRLDVNSHINTLGSVILKNEVATGNAILGLGTTDTSSSAVSTTDMFVETTDTSTDKIQITGNIANNFAAADSYINVTFGNKQTAEADKSFFKGNSNLVAAGNTSLTFDGTSYWTGNNNVNTTTGGAMTASFKGTAVYNGTSTLTNGKNTINIAGDAAWQTGENTVLNGTNSINLAEQGAMHVGNNVSGGTNTMVATGTSTWDKDNTVTGGVNTITFEGAAGNQWTGASTVSNATNTVNLKNNGKWVGDSTLLSGTNTINISDAAVMQGNNLVKGGNSEVHAKAGGTLDGNNVVEAGTMVGTFEDSTTTWNGDNLVSGGSADLTFTDSTWSGVNNITGGTNQITLAGSATKTGSGDFVTGGSNTVVVEGTANYQATTTVNGNATNTIVVRGTSGTYSGDLNLNKGTNNIMLTEKGDFSGAVNVNNGVNNIQADTNGVLSGKLTVTNGSNTGNFSGDAKMTGMLQMDGGSSVMNFGEHSSMDGEILTTSSTNNVNFTDTATFNNNNTATGGIANITLSDGSIWTGNNTASAMGSTVLTLNGTAAEWHGNSSVETVTSKNTTSVTNGSKWFGDSKLVDGNNTVYIGAGSSWEGKNDVSGTAGSETNAIILDGAGASWKGDSLIHTAGDIGNNTVTATAGASWEGENKVTSGKLTGSFTDASFKGNNVVISTDDTSTGINMNFYGNSSFEGDNILEAGDDTKSAIVVTGADNFTWNGNVEQKGGQSAVHLSNTSTWNGDLKVEPNGTLSEGRSDVFLRDGAAWNGNSSLTSGANFTTLTGSSVWTGDLDATGGKNNITLRDNGSWEGATASMSGDSSNSIYATGHAKVNVANIEVSSTTTDGSDSLNGYFEENAQLNSNLTTDGAATSTVLEFVDNTSWNNATNTVNDGTVSITASNAAKLNSFNNVVEDGVNTIDLADSSAWIGSNTVNDGDNTVSLADNSSFNGDNSTTGGNNLFVLTDSSAWTGSNNTSGGASNISFADNSSWQGSNNTSGGDSGVSLTNNSTWQGDNSFTGGVNAIKLENNSSWVGNSTATAAGTNDITLTDASKWQGTANDTGAATTHAALAGTSTWFVTGNSLLYSLDVTSGTTVDMIHDINNNPQHSFNTLTVDTLSGSDTTFKLETDLDKAVYGSETTDGDKLVVNGTSTGTHFVQVADESLYSGTEINGDRKLLLITDESGGNYNFEGKKLNQGGLWEVNPPTLFQEGNKWYLGYIKKDANPDTTVTVLDRHTVYNQWTRINNDSLRKRLGDLRYSNGKDGGVWARAYGGRLEGTGYRQNYNTVQVGLDKTNGHTTYGLAVDKQSTSQNYEFGYGKGENTNISLYATRYTDNGSYWDVIGKAGKINSAYYTNGAYPDHADYDTKGYSLSVEHGKTNSYAKGYFVEPKAQLTYGHLTGNTYSTVRKTVVNEDAISSLMARLGVVVGRKLNNASDYYLKAHWFKEFKADRHVHMTAANGENMRISEDLADSWFEFGLGGNIRIANKTHLYGDIERSLGAEVDKKWQINAGIRWEF